MRRIWNWVAVLSIAAGCSSKEPAKERKSEQEPGQAVDTAAMEQRKAAMKQRKLAADEQEGNAQKVVSRPRARAGGHRAAAGKGGR